MEYFGLQDSKETQASNDVIAKRHLAKSLAKNSIFERSAGEPLPPWLKYPEILIGSVGWRMGYGEDYLFETFYPYWQSLSRSEQRLYLDKYDLGSDWPDRDQWLNSLERNRKASI